MLYSNQISIIYKKCLFNLLSTHSLNYSNLDPFNDINNKRKNPKWLKQTRLRSTTTYHSFYNQQFAMIDLGNSLINNFLQEKSLTSHWIHKRKRSHANHTNINKMTVDDIKKDKLKFTKIRWTVLVPWSRVSMGRENRWSRDITTGGVQGPERVVLRKGGSRGG